MAVAFVSWLSGPLLVPAVVGVAALLDQPVGLLVGGLAALWWAGCLVLLTRFVAGGRTRRARPWRDRLPTRIIARVLWWLTVGSIWAVTTTGVTLTVARQEIPGRNGGIPLEFGDDGPGLVAVAEMLGWAAFGLSVVGPVLAWVATPRTPVSDPPPPAAP